MKLAVFPVTVWFALATPVLAQTTDDLTNEMTGIKISDEIAEPEIGDEITKSEIEEEEAIESDSDGSLDDAMNSIDVRDKLEGVGLSVDVRIGQFETETDESDTSSRTEDFFGGRWRFRTEAEFNPYLRAVGRIAGLCSTEECSPNPVLEDSIPTTNGMTDGDITIDEAYLHWFRLDRFNLALGRMQTKFVARGGVFAKSLDRNDSNNINVNWTDGLHATFRSKNGWVPNLILQHNSSDGASNVRRSPLDFDDSGARVSYFSA